MTRRVLLVEIGTPAELPVVTPPAPRPPSSWVPDPRPSPGLPPPTGLAVVSIADAAVLTWTPSVAGGQTIIEAAPDNAGSPGIWREVDRTGADTYTLSLPGGARWARVRAELNGRTSVATNAVLAEPIDVGGSISEFEQELRDIADLVDTVAAQAAADAAALNARADDLRDDIDATIAEVSTLADLTEDLGTEINRVETESISRDTATVETIDLLGAKNADGTAFILDGNTLRVTPDQTMAQWRASLQADFGNVNARIDAEETARADGDSALATTLATVQATADNAATKAELTAEQTARAAADAALSQRTEAMESRMPTGDGDLATAQSVAQVTNRVDTVEDTVSAHSGQLATHTAEIAGKADSTTVTALDNYVKQDVDDRISTNASAISSVNTQIGTLSASVTQLSEVTGAANLTNLINAGFETGDGWSASSSGGPLPDGIGYSTTGQPRTGTRTMRFFNNGTIFNLGRTPVTAGELLTFGGWVRAWGTAPPAGARFHVGLRHRDASGSFMSGQNVAATVNGTGGIFGYTEAMRTYAVPAGAAHVEMYIIVEGMSVGSVQWDDMYIERVGRAEAEMRARYSLAVTAGGDVAGMQLLAGGGTSAIRMLADQFSIVSPSGDGMTLEDGTQWNRRGNYSMISGPSLGGGMLFYIGPTPSSPGAASKANALMYVDTAGDAYFAGRVLQGVLRWFTSTDSTAANASTTTGSNPRLGKAVSLAVRYQFSEFWAYTGGTVTPGSGATAATIVIERRYGSGSWTTLTTRNIQGISSAYNNPPDPPSWSVNIDGNIYAGDTASTTDSEYRARITSRSVQGHSPGTGGQPVVRSQYLSIEAME